MVGRRVRLTGRCVVGHDSLNPPGEATYRRVTCEYLSVDYIDYGREQSYSSAWSSHCSLCVGLSCVREAETSNSEQGNRGPAQKPSQTP